MEYSKIVVSSEGGLKGKPASHFAHCTHFIVFTIKDNKIVEIIEKENPYFQKHEPGVIPKFVQSLGADVLITNGIGSTAVDLFKDMNIQVVSGVDGDITELVNSFLKGELKRNENTCDH